MVTTKAAKMITAYELILYDPASYIKVLDPNTRAGCCSTTWGVNGCTFGSVRCNTAGSMIFEGRDVVNNPLRSSSLRRQLPSTCTHGGWVKKGDGAGRRATPDHGKQATGRR